MTRAPTKATVAGRAYLALQSKARAEGRVTAELLQLFALDGLCVSLSGTRLPGFGGSLETNEPTLRGERHGPCG